MSEVGSDIEFVVALAESAGSELDRLFRAPHTELDVAHKEPRDLVTSADRNAEERIVSAIQERFPDDAILAEERGGARHVDGRTWIIDPLDGTTNFAHGHPLFAISIALWEPDTPLLAVIHAPRLGETVWAERGSGTFRDGQRVRVSDETELPRSLLATGFSYGRAELDAGALEVFGRLLRAAREIRRGGSAALDLCHTACGVFGGFWEHHLQPHDVAAGALLVREAGGVVTDAAGGDDFLFGGSIVAGNPAVHESLVAALQR